jgi:RNA polymerase sigma-70 factor (ECF subfamily)
VLLRRYVSAWEEADVGAFVSLLREDATLAMPPCASWYRARDAIGIAMRGVQRLVPTRANGCPALAMYSRDPESGVSKASVLHVLAIESGAIATVDAFVDGSLFSLFGLPATL